MYFSRYGSKRKDTLMKALGAKPYQMKQAKAAASRYSHDRLARFVQDMIRASYLAKTTSVDIWNDVELAVLRLLRKDMKGRTESARPAGNKHYSGKPMT
jgi:DNA polymerase III delta subunit